jgi:PTH1 family peptidyl-tRNA hydrolase
MRLIVGLGNPGEEYERTWHNMGFLVIDRLAAIGGVRRFRQQAEANVAEASVAGERVLLAKPQTFMNLSGNAVRPLLERFGEASASNLIVACDDVALPLGMIRVRQGGSAGGQKGLKSIIERTGTTEFPRVRLGIRPDHPIGDLADYVLSGVPSRLRDRVEEMTARAAEAVEVMISSGTQQAMQKFNERVKADENESQNNEGIGTISVPNGSL